MKKTSLNRIYVIITAVCLITFVTAFGVEMKWKQDQIKAGQHFPIIIQTPSVFINDAANFLTE